MGFMVVSCNFIGFCWDLKELFWGILRGFHGGLLLVAWDLMLI